MATWTRGLESARGQGSGFELRETHVIEEGVLQCAAEGEDMRLGGALLGGVAANDRHGLGALRIVHLCNRSSRQRLPRRMHALVLLGEQRRRLAARKLLGVAGVRDQPERDERVFGRLLGAACKGAGARGRGEELRERPPEGAQVILLVEPNAPLRKLATQLARRSLHGPIVEGCAQSTRGSTDRRA